MCESDRGPQGGDSCSGTVCVSHSLSLSHSVTLWVFRRIAGWNVMNSHRLFSFLRLGGCDLTSGSAVHHTPAINKGVLAPGVDGVSAAIRDILRNTTSYFCFFSASESKPPPLVVIELKLN